MPNSHWNLRSLKNTNTNNISLHCSYQNYINYLYCACDPSSSLLVNIICLHNIQPIYNAYPTDTVNLVAVLK